MSAKPQEHYYELYRSSSLGLTLADTIDEMVLSSKIDPQVAMTLIKVFDRVAAEVLATSVKARMSFKGDLETYRFCDEVWTFIIKNIKFKMENQQHLDAKCIKIVAMNSKKPGET